MPLPRPQRQGDDLFQPIPKEMKEPKIEFTKETIWTSISLSQYIRQLLKKGSLTKIKISDSVATPIYPNLILKDWVKFERTINEVEEYEKCKLDKYYFITTYCKKDLTNNYVINYKFEDFIKDNRSNKNIIYYNKKDKNDSRDVTFMLAAHLLWEVLFNDNRDCVVLFNTLGEEESFLSMFVLLYSLTPHFLQRGVKSNTKHVISINGECNIYCYHGKEFSEIYFIPDLMIANDVSILNDTDYDRFIRLDIPKMIQDESTKLYASAGMVNFKGRFLENYNEVEGFDFSELK